MSNDFKVGALLLLALGLAGCATAYVQGASALRQGRYEEAAGHFEEVLTGDPASLDALVGLGVSRYKLGELGEAEEALNRAVARAPGHGTARLYLGLAHLRQDEIGPAEEHLRAYLRLAPDPRVAAQVDRGLRLLRGDPVSGEVRDFLAASLEEAASLGRDLVRSQQALRAAEFRLLAAERPVYVLSRCR